MHSRLLTFACIAVTIIRSSLCQLAPVLGQSAVVLNNVQAVPVQGQNPLVPPNFQFIAVPIQPPEIFANPVSPGPSLLQRLINLAVWARLLDFDISKTGILGRLLDIIDPTDEPDTEPEEDEEITNPVPADKLDWILFPDTGCRYKYFDNDCGYQGAKAECELANARLVSTPIREASMIVRFIEALIPSDTTRLTWIGLDNLADDTNYEFTWSDLLPAGPAASLPWERGGPGPVNSRRCVVVVVGSPLIDNIACYTNIPHICEYCQ